MDALKLKQQWSEEETSCFLALWSSAEVQSKLDGASRTKPVLQQIQREMATAGFDRSVEQISNKLKKLKKDYRDQKKDLGRSGNGRPRQNPHFDILDSVLGDRPACQVTGALNSATIMLESIVDDSLLQSCTEPELSAINDGDDNVVLPPPLGCSSPTPSCSSSGESSAERGKRKRDSTSELVQYLERADERFLQHSKEMDEALRQDMRADTHSLLGLMGRMVAIMETQAQKNK